MNDEFIFHDRVLAKVYKDVEGKWYISYSNDCDLFFGAVHLLTMWELEMYEKYKDL